MTEQPTPTDKKALFLYIVTPCYNEKAGHIATAEETNLIFRRVHKQLGFKQSTCDYEAKDWSARVDHLFSIKLLNMNLDAVTPFSITLLSLIATLENLLSVTGIGLALWRGWRILGKLYMKAGKVRHTAFHPLYND